MQNTVAASRAIGVLGMAPPLLSNFLPDCSIHVTTNTFVRFMEGETECIGMVIGITECIGMVIGIKVAERAFTVHCFVSFEQLRFIVDNLRNDVSFWSCLRHSVSPSYVCDLEIIVEVGHAAINGMAFVFFESGKASTGYGKCLCCILFFKH